MTRKEEIKQFFWQQFFDRFDRNRCIRHIGHLLYVAHIVTLFMSQLKNHQTVG